MNDNKVAIIGGGTMGNGIAEVFAVAGHPVYLYDVSSEVCEKGLAEIGHRLEKRYRQGRLNEQPDQVFGRIEKVESLDQVKEAELVVEAIVERIDVKQDVFRKLDDVCPLTTVLATNTSSLSVTEIAAVAKYPERIIGIHFFNPAPVMLLVEVVASRFSSHQAVEKAISYAKGVGKVPIRVSDNPGFIVNRVARPFYNEALRIAGERIATFEQIDKILTSAGFRMGPFELQDLIGIDINYATTKSIFEAFFQDSRFRPHFLQRMLVQAGTLGRKTGRGYYQYDKE